MKNIYFKQIVFLSLIVLLSACGTTSRWRFQGATEAYEQNDYCKAADSALGEDDICSAKKDDIDLSDYNIDEQLNAGSALFLAKKNELSHAFFDGSSAKIHEEINDDGIGRGIVEVAVNASMVDYNPMIMDSIFLHSYAFYNALALKDKDEAKLQINRAYNVQQNAVKMFNDEIKEQQEQAKKEIEKLEKSDKYNDDAKESYDKNNSEVMDRYKEFAKWKGYKDFVNPYVTYLSGLYFMTNADSRNDYDTASNYFNRVKGMMGENPYVKEDVVLADSLADGKTKTIPATTWVIFENGMVTHLSEWRMDLPIFIATDKVLTASLALPTLKEREAAYSEIAVSNGGKEIKTEVLTDVDNIFISEFNKRLPTIVSKALAKLTMQTALQAASRAAAQNSDNQWAGLISSLASVYSMVTTSADLRSWYSLPKNVQLAKITKAGKDNITLHVGAKKIDVKVPKEGHSLVYVRIPYKESVPVVNVFDL